MVGDQTPLESLVNNDQAILDKLEMIRGQVDTWVQQSEDRLEALEKQTAELAEAIEAQAKTAHNEHTEVGMWTRQMYARITQTENMLKNLAMSIAGVRTPVRMPPTAKGAKG
jgi:hypothetical protein